MIFKLDRLTECGLRLFLGLVLACDESLDILRQLGSQHPNCLLHELQVPYDPKDSHIELAVDGGWLGYVKKEVVFFKDHFV